MKKIMGVLVLVAITLAGCGDTIINQPVGIACVQKEQCPDPNQMICQAGLCKYPPPEPPKFSIYANDVYEFRSDTSALLLVWCSYDCEYTAELFESDRPTGKVYIGVGFQYINAEVFLKDLTPDTPYLVRLRGVSIDSKERAQNITVFRTMVQQYHPDMAMPDGK